MNVLSLFDGISCGQLALNKVGIKYDNYFASEIDKHSIKVTQTNFPNTIQLGDIRNISSKDLPKIDLIIGGSPCQGFSFAGKQLNFEDERSKLFFEYVKLKNELNPKYFLLENVVMQKKCEKIISNMMGVESQMINSNLFSAQNRRRLYWTNININPINDKNITYKNIMVHEDTELRPATIKMKNNKKYVCFTNDKLNTLTTHISNPNGLGRPFYAKSEFFIDKPFDYSKIVKLTPIECERLQTIPDDYTNSISNYKRYVCLGNCWTVDVVAHILRGIIYKEETKENKMSNNLKKFLSQSKNPFQNENCEDENNCERFDDCSECYEQSLKEESEKK